MSQVSTADGAAVGPAVGAALGVVVGVPAGAAVGAAAGVAAGVAACAAVGREGSTGAGPRPGAAEGAAVVPEERAVAIDAPADGAVVAPGRRLLLCLQMMMGRCRQRPARAVMGMMDRRIVLPMMRPSESASTLSYLGVALP